MCNGDKYSCRQEFHLPHPEQSLINSAVLCPQALFLLNVRYVLSAQELPERVNFAFASIAAAGVTAGIVAIKAL